MAGLTQLITAASIFNNHYDYYTKIGVETIMQQSGQLEQVGSDYQGRIIYELLQNAFDKAKSKILIELKDNKLIIANDGVKFSYAAHFDYNNGDIKRGDFQSLCSISTSTKDKQTSIGNKGVGFKSVFSVTDRGYVNIYTNGRIISGENLLADAEIDFRIYEIFKKTDEIQAEFNNTIREFIEDKLISIQKERSDRGVPGYYFPLQIQERTDYVKKLLTDGYVTVVEVPYTNKEEQNMLDMFNEITNVHFQFVQIKHPHKTEVYFKRIGLENKIVVGNNDGNVFIAPILKSVLEPVANAAGILIEDSKVALNINEKKGCFLYNYLPTKVNSPFSFIDFHADFHTTVDRKSINFDGKIGLYNKALLQGCLELYFVILNSYLEPTKRVELHTKFIDKSKVNKELGDFNWLFLNIENSAEIFDIVRGIFQIYNTGQYNYSYKVASEFIAKIAKKYFDTPRKKEQHTFFFNIVNQFIDRFAMRSTQKYNWIELFKSEVINQLKVFGAKVLPGEISLNNTTNLLYKASSKDEAITLPPFVDIKITDFKIEDYYLWTQTGIKEFNDYNEVLKYFKQCTQSGDVADDVLTDLDQKEILKSLYQIFSFRRTQEFLSTHRYSKIYDTESRRNNLPLNQASFSISTIFLKLKNNKYKPAQLCMFKELDVTFLPKSDDSKDLNNFLKYLGVSLSNEYIYADVRIWEKYKNGIDFIPGLIKRYFPTEEISEKLLENVAVIKGSSNYHPATINYGEFKFLYNASKEAKPELDNLFVKKYSLFPASYRKILRDKMYQSARYKDDIIRLYQSVFVSNSLDNHFLIIENEQLSWVTNYNFNIVKSKRDFENCIRFPDKKILCYYSYSDLSSHLQPLICTQESGRVNALETKEIHQLKLDIDEKMIFLLLNISLSKASDLNFLLPEKSLTELQEKFRRLKFIEADQLQQELVYNKLGSLMVEREYAIDPYNSGYLYFKKGIRKSIKSFAIGEYLFNNSSLKEIIELILFHKDSVLLKEESDIDDLMIIRRKWKVDYGEKFKIFQHEILNQLGFSGLFFDKWNIYNDLHRSTLLIEIDKKGRLQDLNFIVNRTKSLNVYDGYFDDFAIYIDTVNITKKASELIVFLESQETADPNLILKIKNLSKRLGTEDELNMIADEIKETYKKELKILAEDRTIKEKDLSTENKIEAICYNLNIIPKPIYDLHLNGEAVSENIKYDQTKTIYQSNEKGETSNEYAEITGISGEEQILGYYVGIFLKLEKNERKKGIISVYDLLVKKMGNESHKKYKENCLANLDDDNELRKNLVPLFYVTLHFKFSYFDLIVLKNGLPTLVEVKTTLKNDNYTFNLPLSEINAARGEDEYEIVRVTPNSIYFIGNPIKQIENQIALIKTPSFQLTPKTYEFTFLK